MTTKLEAIKKLRKELEPDSPIWKTTRPIGIIDALLDLAEVVDGGDYNGCVCGWEWSDPLGIHTQRCIAIGRALNNVTLARLEGAPK